MWRCPKCGARFVTRNMPHSCGRFSLDDHFIGKAPTVRAAFDRLRQIVERCGAVEMIPQKTRIVFLAHVRFAAAMPRRNWLEGHLNLARRVDDAHFFEGGALRREHLCAFLPRAGRVVFRCGVCDARSRVIHSRLPEALSVRVWQHLTISWR